MLILQNVVSGLDQLWTNKVRSVLTVLGIIIAVTSVITIVSIISGSGLFYDWFYSYGWFTGSFLGGAIYYAVCRSGGGREYSDLAEGA